MDNLSSHERARVRDPIESAGAEPRFPPPCGPDVHPIEMVFAKAKPRLGSPAWRTVEKVRSSMRAVLDDVTARDAAN